MILLNSGAWRNAYEVGDIAPVGGAGLNAFGNELIGVVVGFEAAVYIGRRRLDSGIDQLGLLEPELLEVG
jgi:hypothetical protein